jgi:hypothetical protein
MALAVSTDNNDITSFDPSRLYSDSFTLAKDVMQVFYAKDSAKSGVNEEDYMGKLWKTA